MNKVNLNQELMSTEKEDINTILAFLVKKFGDVNKK